LQAEDSKAGRRVKKAAADFIPFRDSKLTRILKQSLGGNSNTAVCCQCNSSARACACAAQRGAARRNAAQRGAAQQLSCALAPPWRLSNKGLSNKGLPNGSPTALQRLSNGSPMAL
jgi:hypothetical protein